MFGISPAALWCLILLLPLLLQNGELATHREIPGATLSLRDFFQTLVQHYDPATVAKFDEVMKVTDQIPSMAAPEIANALPSIFVAFEHRDDTVKSYAAVTIFSVGQRPDGAALLAPYTKNIERGLDLPNAHLQGASVRLLDLLGSRPPAHVVPSLVAFAKRTDRDSIAQADALSILLRIAPENADVVSVLRGFVSRALDERSKEALINGIANSHTESTNANDILITALSDSDEGVRFQAAQAFQRVPRGMLIKAKPALQSVIRRPDESQQVKAAARESLKGLGQHE